MDPDITLQYMRAPRPEMSATDSLWANAQLGLRRARLANWNSVDFTITAPLDGATAKQFQQRFAALGFNADILLEGCPPDASPNSVPAKSTCLRVAWVDYPEPAPVLNPTIPEGDEGTVSMSS